MTAGSERSTQVRPHDLPVCGLSVRLLLHVRRFRCLNPTCPAVTFSERLTTLVAPSAQRTNRLNAALRELALAFGGEAGARQSARSAKPVSSDTLLRRAHASISPARPTPRVVGIDDFAFQKGRVYGTILTDGETHAVVDLLPDRTPETVAAWFLTHPGVEVVTRDRSKEYARGISAGAPQAVQVADRWHVLGNLREALERLLDRLRPQLLALPQAADAALPLSSTSRDRRRGTLDQVRHQASRERRYVRYAEVKRLQAQHKAIFQIARELKLSRQTVRKYMASNTFPEHARPRQQWTMLRRPLLEGYRPPPGRQPARAVEQFVPPAEHVVPQQEAQPLPASRRPVWLLFHFDERLDEEAVKERARLCVLPELEAARVLTRQFRVLVGDRRPEALSRWIAASQMSGIGELKTFADGLQREENSIRAALEYRFSKGVTEGHVHRLKMIKRTAYGRASFELLRQRVLAQV